MTKGAEVPFPAKLAAPKVGKAATRTQLFRSLDEMRNKPVVWIGAPAGSGKTTLVASYLEARKIKPLWYQIDSRDADPATFFAYLRDAIDHLVPRKREPLPLLTGEYLMGMSVYARNFFEKLTARLRPPAVLVFDNFQELPEQAVMHRLFLELLNIVPRGVTVFILSRNHPPASYVSLLARQAIALLGSEEMYLTLEETKEIARLRNLASISPSMLKALHMQTLGWAAGITLVLEHLRSMPQGGVVLTPETRETLFDYFASEVFERGTSQMQRLLVSTAVLPNVTAEAAHQLTGNPEAGIMLARLLKNNFFIMRLSGNTSRYQYHPLFREFLMARGPSVMKAEWPRLRQRAADLLVESGLVEEAAAELAAQGGWEALVPLILRLAPQLAATGRFATLQGWLQSLPLDAGRKNPWVLYWLGHCHMVSDVSAARYNYEEAFKLFRGERRVDGMLLAWAGIVDTALNALNDMRELDLWIDSMDEIIRDFGPLDPQLENQVAPRLFAALVMCRPHHPQFKQWYAAAVKAFEAEQNASFKLLSGFYLFVAVMWIDDFYEANAVLSRLREIGDAPAALPVSRIVRELAEAWLEWTRGNATEAQRAVESGLALGEQTGIHIWTALLLVNGTVSAHTDGNYVLAGEFLGQLKAMLPQARKMDRIYFHHESGWHAALLGNPAEAQVQQAQAVRLVVEMGGLYFEAESRMGMAQAWSLTGEREKRDREYREASRIGSLLRSPIMAFMTAFAGACYALDDEDEMRARALAKNAMQLGCSNGYRNFSWWLPQQAAKLCGFALRQDIEPTYVRDLIRSRGLLPVDEAWQLEAWPWHIKLYTLGRFAMIVDDKTSSHESKAQRRTVDLLKALIALGGRDVPDQRLCEVLWPDAEGDLAHQNFKVTLHRLRKLVGADALVVQDGKLTLDAKHAWVDVWAFERLLGMLDTAAAGNELASLVDEAIKLYKGAFLQGDENSWALTMRERLRGKFLRVIGRAAEQLCSQAHCANVIACYQKGIEIDPLAESFYQGQMQCHLCLKQPAEGLAAYQRCCEALERGLGVAPSNRTKDLYAQLLQLAA